MFCKRIRGRVVSLQDQWDSLASDHWLRRKPLLKRIDEFNFEQASTPGLVIQSLKIGCPPGRARLAPVFLSAKAGNGAGTTGAA